MAFNEKIRTIKDEVLILISMLSGPDTQFYAEDKLRILIKRKFETLFKRRFWDTHCGPAVTVSIDVATGLPSVDMTGALYVPTQDFQDIQWVMRSNEIKPLPRFPNRFNTTLGKRHGIVPTGSASTQFRVIPVGDTSVLVRARRYVIDWTDDDARVPFDSNCLVSGVCFDILNGLGTNPPEEEKYQGQFNQRLAELESDEDNYEHLAGDMGSPGYSDWQEVG